MVTPFGWLRRRRLFNKNISQDVVDYAEFFNLQCTCHSMPQQCTRITAIILAHDVTCILTKTGALIVLDHMSHEELCVLNDPKHSDSVVRSISYNNWNDTIISIWHSLSRNYGLRISIFDRQHVKNGITKPVRTALRLQNLIIPYPGFVELEECNGRIVTSTPDDQLFTFWNIKNYEMEFTISNAEFQEIRISKRTVAFFRQPENNTLSVRLCSIENGEILVVDFSFYIMYLHYIPLQMDCKIALYPDEDLRFLELCEYYLLVRFSCRKSIVYEYNKEALYHRFGQIKQEDSCIRVYSVLEGKDNQIENTTSFLPRAVTFLMEDHVSEPFQRLEHSTQFLAIHNESMEICCCLNGTLIRLTQISIAPPSLITHCLQVIQSKNLILLYTRRPETNKKQALGSYLSSNSPTNSLVKASCDMFSAMSNSTDDDECENSAEDGRPPLLYSKGYEGKDDNTCAGQAGLSVIDMRSGEEICFVPVYCNDTMNVIVYDAVQKEILGGGCRGLHRMRSAFRLKETRKDVKSITPKTLESRLKKVQENELVGWKKASDLLYNTSDISPQATCTPTPRSSHPLPKARRRALHSRFLLKRVPEATFGRGHRNPCAMLRYRLIRDSLRHYPVKRLKRHSVLPRKFFNSYGTLHHFHRHNMRTVLNL